MYIKVHVLDVISCVYGKEMKETTEEAQNLASDRGCYLVELWC